MTTTEIKPVSARASINLKRDITSALQYHVTSNTDTIYRQIRSDFNSGIHAFTIVGSYGVGKSAFLWALANDLNSRAEHFGKDKFADGVDFEILPFTGEFDSLLESFGNFFGTGKAKEYKSSTVLSNIERYYEGISAQKKGLLILVDEFGKHLEYAASHNPGRELYFVQQLAEYVSSPDRKIILITTLHQDFSGYARSLTKTQQNEWDKVKGRLKEITFNEPVEQLLFLAAERIDQPITPKTKKEVQPLLRTIEAGRAFPLKDYFSIEMAVRIQPFDMLSLAVLTLALQKYGQNERSLFSFLETNDRFGLNDYKRSGKKGYYHLGNVYDYLSHNFYAYLNTTRNNPHYAQWAAIRSAIERTEAILEKDATDAAHVIKTIGLLNIFSAASRRLDVTFLEGYATQSLHIEDSRSIIETLEHYKVIRFVRHLNTYVLSEGTALNIEMAIDEAGNLIDGGINIIARLNQYFDFPYEIAKAAYDETGTPRMFAYHLSEEPFTAIPQGEIDGYINLIFSDSISESEVQKYSAKTDEAILYGKYLNTSEIITQLKEIDKVNKVIELHSDDQIAVRELKKIQQHHISLLNHYVMGIIYAPNTVHWYFNGKKIHFSNRRSFNRLLSDICNSVYSETPVYRNELVNKTNLSSPIVTARKKFIAALTSNWDRKDIGFPEKRYPPEKTIYLSLFRDTGLHTQQEGIYQLGLFSGKNSAFRGIWEVSQDFMETTRAGKRNVLELVNLLSARPYKMKKGLIDFWLAFYMFANRDRYALFHKEIFLPVLSQSTLELLVKDPDEYTIKAFNLNSIRLGIFNRYRRLLQLSEKDDHAAPEFIQTIRPFLTFYRELPTYSRQTGELSRTAIELRSAIVQAKDPEELFFEQFPKALGYSISELSNDTAKMDGYIKSLQVGIHEIRSAYDALLQRVEHYLQSRIGEVNSFPAYQIALQKRYQHIRQHLLLPEYKVFYQRLYSEIDNRNAWIASIVQACLGVQATEMGDAQEEILYERLGNLIHEMDNLVELSQSGIDETKEIAYQLEVKSLLKGLKKKLVRLPVGKNEEIGILRKAVQKSLGNDQQLNIATLASLLEDLLSET